MKFQRLTILAFALLMSLSLFSCGKNKPAQVSEESGISRYTGLSAEVPTEVTFEAVYSRTDGYIEKKTYPYITVLNTRAELEKYTAEHEGQYNFYKTSYSDGFYDIVTSYDAVYFADNSLIMILLEEGSGSVRHEVSGIVCEGGKTTITINRILPDGDQTDDMAEWHVLVELPKSSPVLENPDAITVVMNDVKKT